MFLCKHFNLGTWVIGHLRCHHNRICWVKYLLDNNHQIIVAPLSLIKGEILPLYLCVAVEILADK